jgi:hypothetical protein
MKNKILMAAITAAVLSLASCAEKKDASAADGEPVADTVATETTTVASDTIASAVPAEDTDAITPINVSGKVTGINRGKDGYSATIEAEGGKTYTATISIPNMTDPHQYRTVKVGDVITVTGELHDTFIVVRSLD